VPASFRYTENGPEGLIKGKKVHVVTARGGKYLGTPNDSQTPFLRTFLGFIGLTDVSFIHAEGLNLGADAQSAALAGAREAIAAVCAGCARRGRAALRRQTKTPRPDRARRFALRPAPTPSRRRASGERFGDLRRRQSIGSRPASTRYAFASAK
jgi:hypothetical protein